MENRAFIWGLILVGLGISLGVTGAPIIGLITAYYGYQIIRTTLNEKSKEVFKPLYVFITAVFRVIYFFIKEKIFKIKPKKH